LNKGIIFGCNNISNIEKINNLDILEHTGWKKIRHDIRHQKLIDHLNTYKIIVITTGNFPINYLVYKYVEGFSTNSLVICEYNELLTKLGFIPYQHYIPLGIIINDIKYKKDKIFCHNDTKYINDIIDKFLKEPKISENIALNGNKLANEVFSIEKRQHEFNDLIKNILYIFY
jgi:hypothetical protein